MWIPSYHRDLVPDGMDHSEFGEPLRQASLIDSLGAFGAARLIEELPSIAFEGSAIYGKLPPEIRHFEGCAARFHKAVSRPTPTCLFLPDHAALVGEGSSATLVSESLWHSELFFSTWFRNDRTTSWKWRLRRDWPVASVIEDPVGIGYHRYHYQYFHWFVDVMPRIWALVQDDPGRISRWFVGPISQSFQAPSLSLFGIEPESCVPMTDGDVLSFKQGLNVAFRFEEPLNTLRPDFKSGVYGAGWSAEFCDDVRARARAAIPPLSGRASDRLYVARGDATHRRIANEAAVVSLLERFGFVTVTPGQLSFEAQVATFGAARCIVGAHGAGLTNLLWAAPGAQLIEFMPLGLYDVGYRFLAPMAGHRHAAIVCRASPHELGLPFADIEVDLDDLRDALRDAFL